MATICPTVLAKDSIELAQQVHKVAPFAERIQIDLMDGVFAMAQSVLIEEVWWPHGLITDIHLMYQNPFDYLEKLIHLQPNMVIVHVETMVHHMHFAAELHKEGIRAGIAVLPDTPIEDLGQILHSFDHLLIFSGNLGHFGGAADLSLLEKVAKAKEHHPDLEVGWDGGINESNVRQLSDSGVDVLNVGGFIQGAKNPTEAYNELVDKLTNRV